jgi:ferredoxin-NADP reductase
MANQRTARLVSAENIGINTRLLKFALEDELGFTGGQYIIVHTGVPIEENKTAKRAYSLLSSDAEQMRFQIAVRRIDSGPGSNFMFDLPLGSELAFSGPWGKFLPHPADGSSTLLLATDTGITAAMGLARSMKFAPHKQWANILWLSESDSYFLPESFVRERVADSCKGFEVVRIPVDKVEREQWLGLHKDAIFRRMLLDNPATAFLSGDGHLLAAFRDALQQIGPYPPQIFVETFFHHQEMKATAKTALA